MKNFCKLYETDLGQIVIINDTDDDGDPCIKILFSPPNLGVCTVSMGFSTETDSLDEACDKADKGFNLLTQNDVFNIVKEQITYTNKLGLGDIEK